MATLKAGVQYGLRNHFNENKNLLFVKLTDSAHRQILNYAENRSSIEKKPTIKVAGNEGRLCLPSINGHESSFTFSLSGNQDIEGPSGGFECIQQTGNKNLESLGNIPYKMRIHANDDVYETTRNRMAIAIDQKIKNKCTQVIKPNGPDIGRKVKVVVPGRTTTIPPPSNARHRESSSSSASQPKRSPSYRPTTSSLPEKKMTDLMRRPLKERLIHLLALRPFKRPELYDRINKEGMREKEKPIMMTLLRQVASMRDNSYHLHRHVWNDVQEDWPFYTEQEKAMLRRRKPQNLTPPGSSDGSTGSGQSPNSIQPGSPPAITAPPHSLLGNKRPLPGYYQGNDGLPTKKPRISHYRKSEAISSNASGESGRTASGVIGGGSNSGNGGNASWEHQRQQQRERRGDCRPERTANSDVLRGGTGYGSGSGSRSCQASPSDSMGNQGAGYGRGGGVGDGAVAMAGGHAGGSSLSAPSSGSHNSHSSPGYSSTAIAGGDRHYYAGRSATTVSGDSSAYGGGVSVTSAGVDNAARFVPSSARSDNVNVNITTGRHGGSPSSVSADRRNRSDRSRTVMKEDKDWESWTVSNNTSSAASFNGHADITVATAHCDLPIIEDSSESPKALEVNQPSESPLALGSPMALDSSQVPHYLTYYTTITNMEQRRRYKIAFNAHYEEYRRVHALVAEVSKHFSQLYERMTQQANLGNTDECQRLKQQILKQYEEKKNDPVHTEAKKQFNHLHRKLAHIKQLVHDFDSQNYSENAESTSNGCRNESKDFDSRHY